MVTGRLLYLKGPANVRVCDATVVLNLGGEDG